MKDKIQQIIISAQLGGISSIEATQQVLDLFAVSNRRELLFAFEEWYNNEYSPNLQSTAIKEYLKSL
jgi:hypothetical protein